jgi:hypothetical protein
MTREWFSFRLPRPTWSDHQYPAQAISDVVPALVRHLRTVDPEGRWQFRRHPGPPGEELDVWFHTSPTVGDELAHQLHVQAARHDWPASPVRSRPDAPATGLLADLSMLSSDLALDLLADGDLGRAAQLDATSRHLRFLTGLMPHCDRPAFLFLCWQQWSRELAPYERVELVRQAAEPLYRAAGTDRCQHGWDRYFDEFSAALQGDSADPDLPVKYVLFDHAHLTHHRLGIAAGTEALAARVLRAALRGGAAAR